MKTASPVDAARIELLLSDLRLPAIKLMWAKLAEQSDKEGWPAARFVGNAIKFTDIGEVSIKGSSANGTFNVAVRDTGPGISTADQAKLFQEFQQADNSITKKKGGTGLGLAISRRIIEMHGGRIWVESSPGNGSTFAFTLPVTVEEQARPA
jgi:signal transduction histidine kinase